MSGAALVVLTFLAWVWLFAGAGMGMDPLVSLSPIPAHPTVMSDMAMGDAIEWSSGQFALTFSMWLVMMVAMMLPSASPTILLYARASAHKQAELQPATASFLAGYLAAWSAFSLFATILQMSLEKVAILTPMSLASSDRWLSAIILLCAGIYQISPLKDVCLKHCRNPAQFLSRNYAPGKIGALRMGIIHGAYCVGCCWLLMALLFVGGVMNIAWIALLTLMVASEKLLPFGRLVARTTGFACMVWGGVILIG